MPFQNQSNRTRTYVVGPAAELLELDPATRDDSCGGEPTVAPRWLEHPLEDLGRFVTGANDYSQQVSLTFDDAGEVTRIRVSYSC